MYPTSGYAIKWRPCNEFSAKSYRLKHPEIHIHATYTHKYTHTLMTTQNAHTYMNRYTCKLTQAHECTHMHEHTHMHVQGYTSPHVHEYTYMRLCTNTWMYTGKLMHTYKHKQTYKKKMRAGEKERERVSFSSPPAPLTSLKFFTIVYILLSDTTLPVDNKVTVGSQRESQDSSF